MFSKDEILGCNDLKIEKVNVPEWSTDVYVRTITARQLDAWQEDVKKQRDGKPNYQASLLVCCICDENGKLIFDMSDAEKLGEKSASALNRIFSVASKINALGADDVKDLEKN